MTPLSGWESFCAIVAETTNHTAGYVWKNMSYARALRFQTFWFSRQRIEWIYPDADESASPLQRTIQ